MSLDPEQRLEALRREVLAEAAPPPPEPARAPPTPPTPEAAQSTPEPARAAPPTPPPPGTSRPSTAPRPSSSPAPPPPDADGWDIPDLRAMLADTSLATWIGVGLLVVGGYLVLSWFVPGIAFLGSIVILGAGVVLLAQHFLRGSGSWALYAGALLTGIGGARVAGDLLPGDPAGLTALGVGLAFLAIGYLRHSQAGGYGWQGVVGGLFTGLGVVQLVLGTLPGTPGILDLIVPALLIGAGALIVIRSRAPKRPQA